MDKNAKAMSNDLCSEMRRDSDNDVFDTSSMLMNSNKKALLENDNSSIESEEVNLKQDQFAECSSSHSNKDAIRKVSIPAETKSLDGRWPEEKEQVFFHKSTQDIRFSNSNHSHDVTRLQIECGDARYIAKLHDDVTAKEDGSTKSNTCENCGHELAKQKNDSSLIDSPRSDCSLFSLYNQHSSCEFCRICHCGGDAEDPLIAPCKCKGSMIHVHHSCLQRWIKSSGYRHCELCGFQFVMNSKLKPVYKWQKLAMTKTERRKIFCSVIFHIIAITCVVWSLYVLIEKTAMELQTGSLHWPFWTKLAVVAVGLTGGLAFMYVQCKTYYTLWMRLIAFNQIIRVEDRPTVPSYSLPVDPENPLSNDVIEANSIPITNDNRTDTDVIIS